MTASRDNCKNRNNQEEQGRMHFSIPIHLLLQLLSMSSTDLHAPLGIWSWPWQHPPKRLTGANTAFVTVTQHPARIKASYSMSNIKHCLYSTTFPANSSHWDLKVLSNRKFYSKAFRSWCVFWFCFSIVLDCTFAFLFPLLPSAWRGLLAFLGKFHFALLSNVLKQASSLRFSGFSWTAYETVQAIQRYILFKC